MSETPRRLVFGEVAAEYDRHRPSYPVALVDELIARAALGEGRRVLEVGAGTGKATALFAQRGVSVVAVEPSAEMAQKARSNLAAYRQIEVVEADFERFDPGDERFPLLYSAQAWHWIDRETRYRHARAALAEGGLLAVFWNRPAWDPEHELRRVLRDVYERVAPDMPLGPLHPADPTPERNDDWAGEIADVPEFADPEELVYRWSQDYSGADYAGLLTTLSEFRLLDAPVRERLLREVTEAIEQHGGRITLPLATWTYLARAV